MTDRGEAGSRRAAGWIAVLVALAAIGLILLAARSGRTATLTPVTSASTPAAPSATPSITAVRPTAPAGNQDPSERRLTFDLFLTLLAAFVLGLFGYLGWIRFRGGSMGLLQRRRRGRRWSSPPPPPDTDPPPPGPLAEAVDAGLRRLAEGEPQDAVIACWVLLERAAAEAGTARRVSETPAQLVARMLAEHRVTPAVLDRLVGLYREARYSRHVLGEPARTDARTALERVRRELTGEPAAEATGGPSGEVSVG